MPRASSRAGEGTTAKGQLESSQSWKCEPSMLCLSRDVCPIFHDSVEIWKSPVVKC